jgi:hypothetical protein
VITLTEQNNSGLSGSVTLAYSADFAAAAGVYLLVRWPEQYIVASDTVDVLTVADPGLANTLEARVSGLSAGAHSLTVAAVTDTGERGAASSAATVTIPAELAAPDDLARLSGDAAACVVRFRASTTAPGLVHRAYVANCGAVVNTLSIAATATSTDDGSWAAGTVYTVGAFRRPVAWNGLRYEVTAREGDYKSGASQPTWPTTEGATVVDNHVTWTCRGYTITLPAITGYAGTAEMRLTAVQGGVEDGQAVTLWLEFDAGGVFVEPRPNDPTASVADIDGRALTVAYLYRAGGEAASPDTVELYLIAEGASPAWGTPDATQAIAAESAGQRRGTIVATASADGFFRWAVRVLAGSTRNPSTDVSGPEYLSTATVVPTGLEARLTI